MANTRVVDDVELQERIEVTLLCMLVMCLLLSWLQKWVHMKVEEEQFHDHADKDGDGITSEATTDSMMYEHLRHSPNSARGSTGGDRSRVGSSPCREVRDKLLALHSTVHGCCLLVVILLLRYGDGHQAAVDISAVKFKFFQLDKDKVSHNLPCEAQPHTMHCP